MTGYNLDTVPGICNQRFGDIRSYKNHFIFFISLSIYCFFTQLSEEMRDEMRGSFTEKTSAYKDNLARRLVLRRDRDSGSESFCDHAELVLNAVLDDDLG